MLMMARKKKNVIIFLLVIFGCCLGSVKLIEEDVKNEEQVCSNNNTKQFDLFSIVSVGLLSATIFALVGVLPSVFIRSDADEARFG